MEKREFIILLMNQRVQMYNSRRIYYPGITWQCNLNIKIRMLILYNVFRDLDISTSFT